MLTISSVRAQTYEEKFKPKNLALAAMDSSSASMALEAVPVVTQYYGASSVVAAVGSFSELEMLGGAEQTLG